jgi:tetratricopeptide (TPR) repeat protein
MLLALGCSSSRDACRDERYASWLEKNLYNAEFMRQIGNERMALYSYEMAIKSIGLKENQDDEISAKILDQIMETRSPIGILAEIKAEIYFGAGLCYFKQGQIDKSITLLNDSIKKYGYKFAHAHKYLGLALYKVGRYDESLMELTAARQTYKEDYELYIFDSKAEAEVYLRKPENPLVDVCYYIGKIFLIKGEKEKAKEMFKEEIGYGEHVGAEAELRLL